jgi:hypothetical protein
LNGQDGAARKGIAQPGCVSQQMADGDLTLRRPRGVRRVLLVEGVTAATTPGISPLSTAAWNMRSIARAPLASIVGNRTDPAG